MARFTVTIKVDARRIDQPQEDPMTTTHPEQAADSSRRYRMRTSLKTASLMVATIGGFYLLREHWNHVTGYWVYLLLLACPLMHLFHGHGHGHGAHGGHDAHGALPNKTKQKKD
jgi:hypothetical protein